MRHALTLAPLRGALGKVGVRERTAHRAALQRRHVEKVVAQFELSPNGAKYGAVVLWLQASKGAGQLIGDLGGVEALCRILNRAVSERSALRLDLEYRDQPWGYSHGGALSWRRYF